MSQAEEGEKDLITKVRMEAKEIMLEKETKFVLTATELAILWIIAIGNMVFHPILTHQRKVVSIVLWRMKILMETIEVWCPREMVTHILVLHLSNIKLFWPC